MSENLFERYDSAYNEGFLYASQLIASAIIRSIRQHPSWMLEPARNYAIAQIKLTTRYVLEKRRLVPTSYQVMRGNAEDVKLDFNLFDNDIDKH